MSLISFKIIFQCVSWRDKLASSAKNRLNAETIGAALGAAHRSPCEPHKGLTGGWMGGAWLSLARRFSLHRALQMRSLAPSTVGEFEKERTDQNQIFFWREKLDVWRESVWKHAKACVTQRSRESWQLWICARPTAGEPARAKETVRGKKLFLEREAVVWLVLWLQSHVLLVDLSICFNWLSGFNSLKKKKGLNWIFFPVYC